MKSFLFIVRKFWLVTVLNLLGLSVAYCAFYYLTTQIDFSTEYNRQVPDYERCYRLENCGVISDSDWIDWCTYDMKLFADTLPEVEQAVTFSTFSNSYEVYGKNGLENWNTTQYNGDIFRFFGVEVVDGDINDTEANNLVINSKKALDYFGEINVAGREINTNKGPRRISAVVEKLHDNYLLQGDIFEPYINADQNQIKHSFNTVVVMRLCNTISPSAVEEAYKQYLSKLFGSTSFHNVSVRLTPFAETYFSQVNSGFDQGSRITTLILRLSALLVLVLAVINFVNFSLAQAPTRVSSINIRKILGSSNMAIRLSIILENVAISLLALGLAVLVIFFVSDTYWIHTFLLGNLELENHLPLVLKLFIISILTGLISGMYPAWFATSFQPSVAVKGSVGLSPKGKRMRSALMLVQFAISIFMFIYLTLMVEQGKFVLGSEYGYCKDAILFAQLPQKPALESDEIEAGLQKLPGVESVSFSQFLIGNDNHREVMTLNIDDTAKVMFTILRVSSQYLDTYGIGIRDGRNFQPSDTDAYIINEAMLSQLHSADLSNFEIWGNRFNVVGICDNLRLHSMRFNGYIDNVVFQYSCTGQESSLFANKGLIDRALLNKYLSVRVDGSIRETAKRNVEDYFRRNYPDENVEVNYFDHSLIMLYNPELRFGRQIVVSTSIIDIIMLIGVACLTLFEVQYRRKEIGIRKVLGSSNFQILTLLGKRYIRLLLTAFAISAPLAYVIGNSWLSTFAEHVEMSPMPFVLGFTGVVLDTMSMLAISALSSLRGNIINNIKTS